MKKTLLTFIILATALTGFAQVAINTDGSSPNSNAMLDVKSSDKGVLIPRMTTNQRTTFGALLGTADAGMMVYDTDLKVLFVFDGSIWVSSTSYWTRVNDYVFNTTDSIGIGTATPGAELDVQGHIWQTGTGGSVFLGKSAGANDDYSSNFNVFVGDSAGNLNTTGSRNVAMGYQALLKNKSGDGNIAIGSRALYRSTKNTNLIAIGESAMYYMDSVSINGGDPNFGKNMITIGNNALKNQLAGKSNTVIGHSAVETGGISESIIIGDSALTSGHADSSVVIGNKALFKSIHQEGIWPHASVIIGDKAMYNFGNWASGGTYYGDFFQNTVIGARAFYHLLEGEHNVAVGRSVGNGLTGALDNVAIGDFAMSDVGSSSVTPEYNVSVGHYSGRLSTDSKFNTSIGYGAGTLVKYYNVAVGYGALGGGQTSVENNVAIGADALYYCETNNNIGIGFQALQNNANGSQNLALGYRAGINSSGSNNILIGINAGQDLSGSDSLIIGNLYPTISGDLNTANLKFHGRIQVLGGSPSPGKVLTVGTDGWSSWEIPDPAGAYVINDLTDAIYDGSSLFLGYGAGTHDDNSNENTAVGKNALWTNISGIQNVAIGVHAGYQSTGNGNIFIGYNAGSQETGNNKLYIANSMTSTPLIGGDFSTSQVDINGTLKITGGSPAAGRVLTSDANGLASWQDAVGAIDDLSDGKTTTGSCVFLGLNAGASITTGTGNTGLGLNALNAVADGSQNTALGYQALKSNVSGNGNTATGFNAISTNTSGSSNTAIGYYAGFLNTGSGNVFLGYQAGYNETGSNKLYIANSNTTTPLIGGDFSTGQVDINGTIKITGGNPGNGKILTSDANGLASWGTAPVSADGSIDTHSDVDVSTTAPTNGQVLSWNGTNWVPADDNLGAQNIDGLSDGISDGTSTLFLGTGAGASNTASAFFNTAVGLNALNANTAGSFNTALGYESMKNTTGGSNTAVGYSTLNANTTGYSNFAGGTSALAANVDGYNNTATGSAAMASNTSGNNNAGYGYQALNANTLGYSNTAVGSGSLKSNTNANNNVAVGFEALNLVTTNGNNTAIGANAGHNATGTGNVFIGYQAGFSETGNNKLYIANSTTSTPLIGGDFSTSQVDINGTIKITGGFPGTGKVLTSDANGLASWQTPATPTLAINDLTDAVYDGSSLFMGNGAGSSDGGSNNNTGVGKNALNANVTGDYNSAFGLNSLLSNTAGSFNDAFGNAALKSNSTGSNNAAFGYTALSFLTSGNGNAAFGWAALNALSSGDENIAIGYGAGFILSGGAGTYSTGTHSIFIGPMTKSLNNADTNQIVIGRYAVGLGSNTVVIGNNDIDTTALYGNVGIGTTSPQSKLQVNGGVQVADDTDAATANKVGTLRYRADSNNSYVEMCVQTGATTYAWVVIHQETW